MPAYSTTSRGFRLPRYLRPQEAEHFLEAISSLPMPRQRNGYEARYAALATLYYTGMRRAEVLGLDLDDIDWETATLRVLGKGNKERLVPMHPDLEVILRSYLADRVEPKESRALFVSIRKRRISRETLEKWVKAAGCAAGIPWLHPHVLRHTLATRVLRKTHDLSLVQRLLGHSSITTTTIYVHTDVADMARALEAAV